MLTNRLLLQRPIIRLYHNGAKFKRNTGPVVKLANTRLNQAVKTRRSFESNSKVQSFGPKQHFEPFPFEITAENKAEKLQRTITPLYDIPYDEQLSSKEAFCRNSLRGLAQELFKDGTPVRIDVKRLPCHVNTIVPSTQLTRYRNKDEFSIWRGYDGTTITAGFMIFPIGKHGDTVCVEPNSCEIIKEEVTRLMDLIQVFLREQAKLPVCFSLGDDGGWRRFMVRTNVDGDIMLIGVLNPRGLRVQEVLDERDNFRDFIVQKCSESNLKLTSLYYQPCAHNKCKHVDVPYELLFGEPKIQETICNKKFVVSPESFMHDNTKAAEIMLTNVKKTIEDCFSFKDRGVKPLVIDAQCGIGLLSLELADIASRVIGVDSSDQAIDDARANAKLNGIDNVEFVCSDLEIVLERILEKYAKYKKDILVVCDTPNSGLHTNSIQTLRNCIDVNRMIFTTPNINGPLVRKNLLDLCSKGKARSIPPFAPILAVPVDTRPHVESFETILALERLPA